MLITTLIILATSVLAFASNVPEGRVGNGRAVTGSSVCGTTIQPAAVSGSSRQKRQSSKTSIQPRQDGNSSVPLPIDVYMQVLTTDGTEAGGNIPDSTIAAQIQILNDAFLPVGFRFRVVETIRTVNERWYYNLNQISDVEKEVTAALRKGSNSTLNIYTMGTLNTTTQAWATVPSELQWGLQHDGAFINTTVFLGGSDPIYTQGDTLVHEVGHWFGLYHTFAYGCEASYDYVDDTPIEDQPPYLGGCDVGRDSCPEQPGLDSVKNYMGYSSDECRDQWTPGQVQRMREQMAKFRGVVYPGIVVGDIPEDGE